jgi:DNA-binding XRE family transcriptional regulator
MKSRLKEIREERHMSVMEFAGFLQVNYSTYVNWELGNSFPPLKVAFDIAEKLNKKVDDIWFK